MLLQRSILKRVLDISNDFDSIFYYFTRLFLGMFANSSKSVCSQDFAFVQKKKIINCTFYYSTDSRCNKYFLKSLFAWTNVFPEYLAQPRTLLEQSSRLSKGSGKFKRYALLSQKQIMNNSKSRDRNLVSASKVSRGFVQMSNSFIDIAFAKMRSSIGSSKPDSSLILFIRSDLSCLRLT